MNILDKVKQELEIDAEDITKDEAILFNIELAKAILEGELNNDALDFENMLIISGIVYITCLLTNDETRFGVQAGKQSENMGVNIQFIDALPSYLKDGLRLRFFKVVT